MTLKKLFYWLPLLLWLAVIYQSSSQPYHEQDMRPWLRSVLPEQYIIDHFSDLKLSYNGNEISIETKGVAGFVEFIIRKAAHVVAFAIFSFLLLFALWNTTKIRKWHIILISLIGSFLFACSDELHQMYTGGRSPQFTDVMIDMVGTSIGIFIFLLIIIVKRRRLS